MLSWDRPGVSFDLISGANGGAWIGSSAYSQLALVLGDLANLVSATHDLVSQSANP